MAELPTGTVTLLFSDIEGSTRLLPRVADAYAQLPATQPQPLLQLFLDASAELLATPRALLLDAFGAHGGVVVDSEGDAFFVAFGSAKDAAGEPATPQRALAGHEWAEGEQIRVRIGLHPGEPRVVEVRYVG